MIGRTLGHYRITEKIGAGGMGEVYRAHDEHLDRDVALKVLPPGLLAEKTARSRFHKEALALSKLNHPNIATVHDFDTEDGVDFLVMEYVAGQTLTQKLANGPLPEKEMARVGRQVAEALEEAHERGLVHRDLKPSNIVVTTKGQAKVLDFGLAKLLRPGGDLAATQTLKTLTEVHGVSGTLPYMSPEQLRDEPLDARTDIYSLGVVLYEMATGQRPFREALVTRLTEAVLYKQPVPPRSLNPTISAGLERTILKCLEKDAENRYQSAKEIEVDLRRLTSTVSTLATELPVPVTIKPRRKPNTTAYGVAGAVIITLLLFGLNVGGWRQRLLGGSAHGHIDSLAVLPLENLSGNPGQDYFADGMTEELITVLSQISALKVISRTSVMQYKGAKKPLRQIAKELNVAAVMEGSVLRDNGRVRITAKLIEAATDRNIWAHSYERDLKEVLALQDDVARAIAEEIQIRLNPKEATRLAGARPVDPGAYEAYLKGRYFWNQRTLEAVTKGLTYFQQAVETDPTYALGYAGVADSYVVLGADQWLPPGEAFPRARAAALKALELDNSLAEAHAALAEIALAKWNWEEAEREYKFALELNPGYAVTRQWYSTFLSKMGRFQEAVTEAKRAAELDPLSPIINTNEAQILFMARRFDEAREKVLKTLELAPNFVPARFYLGVLDMQMGRLDEAIAELERTVSLSSSNDALVAMLGHAYARAGRKTEARKLLDDLILRSKQNYVSPFQIALVCVGLGEKDQAIHWLEKGYKDHDNAAPDAGSDPIFDPLRSDPRFQDLLRRMKLPEAGASH